jgi:hypothetical protein
VDTPQLLAVILGAGGGASVLLALITGLGKWISGASGRERAKNTDLESQRMTAVEGRKQADLTAAGLATKLRKTEEYASRLRRQLFEAGLTPESWPDIDSTLPAPQLQALRNQSEGVTP